MEQESSTTAHVPVDVHEQDGCGRDAGSQSDWEQAATHVVRAALCLPLRDRLAAAQPVAWDTGLDRLDSDEAALYHCGLVWLLRVLATTPTSGCAVAQRLLDEHGRLMLQDVQIYAQEMWHDRPPTDT